MTGIHREHLSSMRRLVRGNCLFWRGLLGDGGKLQFVGEGGVCQVQLELVSCDDRGAEVPQPFLGCLQATTSVTSSCNTLLE